MNPLMNIMGKVVSGGAGKKINPQMIASAKRMMNMLGTVTNPAGAIEKAARQNPMLGSILSIVGNRDPKEVFYEQYLL